jgi:hypothetical protein
MSESNNSDDYVWHFALRSDDAPQAEAGDGLTEMVRSQISALLRCVQLTSNGRGVRVTGFRFLDDPDQDHRIQSSLVGPTPETPSE